MAETKEYIVVLKDCKVFGKEVNTKTNAKMGKRHIAFESMLETIEVDEAQYWESNRVSATGEVVFSHKRNYHWIACCSPIKSGERFLAQKNNKNKLSFIELFRIIY